MCMCSLVIDSSCCVHLILLLIPSHFGGLPLHVPVVTVPSCLASQILVFCPTRTNPVLATDPRSRVRELAPRTVVAVPFSGACMDLQVISPIFQWYMCAWIRNERKCESFTIIHEISTKICIIYVWSGTFLHLIISV